MLWQRRSFLQSAAALTAAATLQPMEAQSRHAFSVSEGPQQLSPGPARLNVRDTPFNAAGDSSTKDTSAFQAALDRCAALGGGEVLVPAGDYLLGAVQLRSNTVLHLEYGAVLHGSPELNDYPTTIVRWEGRWIPGHVGLLYAIDAQNVAVVGHGSILGSETVGGRPTPASPLRRPALLEFLRCRDVLLRGFSTHYARMWSIHPTACQGVRCEDLTIRSETGNGDGIDVDSCRDVWIERCDIATGDDCISLKSGRGLEGYTLAQATENVVIRDCTLRDSIFACIGIGSETSGGIRNVRIERCRFTGAKTFALYIKSRPGRGAAIENIFASDLQVIPSAPGDFGGGFLRFNLLNSGLLGEDPVPGREGIPQGRNFVFRNIHVEGLPMLVDGAAVPAEKPLEGLVLENITGSVKQGVQLANARRVLIRNVHVELEEGPLLTIRDVQGSGLQGAALLNALPHAPEPVPGRTGQYRLR